jgi:hypothetical protein
MTQTLASRDIRAQTAVETAIRSELTAPAPKAISISVRENHSGEPSLYVYVVMPSIGDVPGEPEQNRLVVRMLAALEQIDDRRFPYLFFGPEESSEPGGARSPEDEDV